MNYKKFFQNTILVLSVFIITQLTLASSIHSDKTDNSNSTYYQVGGSDWVAPSYADKLKNPLAGNMSVLKDAKNLFKTNCASCHGDKGEGNGPAAASLTPKPKNLTSAAVQKQSDGVLFWKITTGKSPMLSWKDALTEKQRWEIVNYIRQLKKK